MRDTRTIQVVGLCMLLLTMAACAYCQSLFVNPSFEAGLAGWTTYTFTSPPAGEPEQPLTGCVGSAPCPFDVIPPPSVPDGTSICGMQAWGFSKNGGVRQVISWLGGPGSVSVTARAFSKKFPFEGSAPWDNGCRVRMALVAGEVSDRESVTGWLTFPWGDAWYTRSIDVSEAGLYTLFIEGVQPAATAVMSTAWDNVVVTELPPVMLTNGPVILKPGDAGQPESTVKIEWTTDVPSSSRVDYGLTTAYGQSATDSALVTDHSVLLTGLTHSSTYHFRVTSSASGYVTVISDDSTFRTSIDITDISATPGSVGTSMVIRWKTDVPCSSKVYYGPNLAYGQSTVEDTTLVTDHEVLVSGLTEDVTYHFKVWGQNLPLYQAASSSDHTFSTLPAPSATLQNGGLENGHAGVTHSLYPWVQYTTGNSSIGYHPIDGLVGPYPLGGAPAWFKGYKAYEGSYFLGAAANWDYKNGGVFQRVQFPPGGVCTLTAKYATLTEGGTNGDTLVRVGIDPNGGIDPTGEGVEWWSVSSSSNDNQWHTAAVTATAGSGGVVSVFLDIRQMWSMEWHVAAIDRVTFGAPLPMTIGQLRQSTGDRSAVLSDEIVTYVDPAIVSFQGRSYIKAYLAEEDRTAGIAVLFDQAHPSPPVVGNRMTVTGSAVLQGMEAMVVAHDWANDGLTNSLPAPLAMSQRSMGGATPIQPAIYPSFGPCTLGLRVRVSGKVTSVDDNMPFVDVTAYLDDGSGVVDQFPVLGGSPKGMRVRLVANGAYGVNPGDYVTATGVMTMNFIDPVWPPFSGDEFYTYTVFTTQPSDWSAVFGPLSVPQGASRQPAQKP